MSEHSWKNIYNLSTDQLNDLDEAEDMIEMMDLTKAETILLKMFKEDPTCVPVCLLYTSPSPRDGLLSRMPSSA